MSTLMKLFWLYYVISLVNSQFIDEAGTPDDDIKSKLTPEQIHLSIAFDKHGKFEGSSAMMVTWVTHELYDGDPVVSFHNETINYKNLGYSTYFKAGKHNKIYIHRATMFGLLPGNIYTYQVGGRKDGSEYYSDKFEFKAFDERYQEPNIVLFGDMAYFSPTIKAISNGIDDGHHDVVIHVGDMAYNLQDDHGTCGDKYFRHIEPITHRIPYLTIPGNHESHENFSHYDNRLSNWDKPTREMNNFYWSIDIGPIHFVAFTTEFYFYFAKYGKQQLSNQYKWLENDLRNVDRGKTPWVIVVGHRPMYCTTNPLRCDVEALILRKGLALFGLAPFGLEELFKKYKVDMYICGHEHNYERLWPLVNGNVANGTVNPDNPYEDAKGTIYIVTGAGGKDKLVNLKPLTPITRIFSDIKHIFNWRLFNTRKQKDKSAFLSYEYSYTVLTVRGKDELKFRQMSSIRPNYVIDEFIVKKKI